MSGADNVIINSFERAVSGDINDLQSLKDRNMLETFKYMLSGDLIVPQGTAYGTTLRNMVLGGLNVSPNVADVDVSAGVLMQNSNSLAPVPTSLDSSFRYARNAGPLTLVLPVGDVYYLVEAQMVNTVVLTATRDIFDPVSQTFTPTIVNKQADRQVTFSALTGTGTTAPTPSGGNFVPIAIVRKVGGVVTEVIDVAPRQSNLIPGVSSVQLSDGVLHDTSWHEAASGVKDIVWQSVVCDSYRNKFWFKVADPASAPLPEIAANSALIASPTNPGAAQTWQYFYMSEWFGLTPRAAYVDHINQGVLVVSDLGPVGQGTRVAPAGIQLPAPFDGYTTLGDGDAQGFGFCSFEGGSGVVREVAIQTGEIQLPDFFAYGSTVAAQDDLVTDALADVGNVFPSMARGFGVSCTVLPPGGGPLNVQFLDDVVASAAVIDDVTGVGATGADVAVRTDLWGQVDVRRAAQINPSSAWVFAWPDDASATVTVAINRWFV